MTANTSVSHAQNADTAADTTPVKRPARGFGRKLALGLLGAIAVATLPMVTAGAASAATPTNACGAGYTYKSAHSLKNAKGIVGGIVRLYGNKSGLLCGTTERVGTAKGVRGVTRVSLTPAGGTARTAEGRYTWFVGPAKTSYSKCVLVSAVVATPANRYAFSHYGFCKARVATMSTSSVSKADIAIAAALAQRGEKYVWGAVGPNSWDCSGLTSYAMARAGKRIPRVSRDQYAAAQKVSTPRRGDLVFYGNPVYHVGLYLGGGQMVHAPRTGDVVKIASVTSQYEKPKYGRVL